MTFSSPLGFFQAPGDNSRFYVMEKGGQLYWVDATNNSSTTKNTYINLTGTVMTDSEGGLLGMAFHPNYQTNRQVYLSFTTQPTSGGVMKSVIARFTESGGVLTASSRTDILTVNQPYTNHNGGNIAFGPDGYLYIAFGDGGSANDPPNSGQTTNTFLGKMLRINVNTTPYSIPSDNPFVGNSSFSPEIYAWGLRNPWRWSFDRQTGTLYLGDVGQEAWEEVDTIQSGLNYGWRCREGNATTSNGCTTSGPYTAPLLVYGHGNRKTTCN
jgi:glucose/arabinose dehydrogenase